MRQPLLFATLSLLAVLTACTPATYTRAPGAPPPQIDSDAWERLTYTLEDDLASGSLREGVLSLQPLRLGGEGGYRLQVNYWGEDWLLIPPGPSLQLTIDGQAAVLSSPGSGGGRGVRTVGAFARRFERAEYSLSPEVLRQLSEANLVGVSVTGSRTLERILDREDLERFVMFYTQAQGASR